MAIQLRINGAAVEVPAGTTVLQACEAAGTEVPRFCYHERLRVAGNCRLCLVEVGGAPKPVASCARPVGPGREVFTETPLVRKARESVREFLLKNHPLDCPICDQGGECDLQEQSRTFGSDRSRRWQAPKQAAEDKERGPRVKTVRTRCIQCTRCVRFASEVAGVGTLGTTGRGESGEIGTYLKKLWKSEIAGNVVDLCPVGALTAAPTAFRHRPWELTTVPAWDRGDSLLSATQVGRRGEEIRRTQPRTDDAVNGEWLTDKGRYLLEGEGVQRREGPRGRHGGEWTSLTEAQVQEALANLPEGRREILVGAEADHGVLSAVEARAAKGGAAVTVRRRTPAAPSVVAGERRGGLQRVEEADAILLVGTDPRREAALLNTRLRTAFLAGVPRASVGGKLGLSYPVEALGAGGEGLRRLRTGRTAFAGVWAQAERPLVIRGGERRRRTEGAARREEVRRTVAAGRRRGRRSAGWSPLRRLLARANDGGQWRQETGVPVRTYYRPSYRPPRLKHWTEVAVRFRVQVSGEERERAGLTAGERRRQAEYNVVLASHGEEWREGSSLILPVVSAVEVNHRRTNREGRTRRGLALRGRLPGGKTVADWRAGEGEQAEGVGADWCPSVLGECHWQGGASVGALEGGPWTVARVDGRREGSAWALQSPTLAKASDRVQRHETNFRERPGD